MNADPTLKPIIKQILGVIAMKKGNEVEVGGERVVMVKASHAEIAEWTGHHKVTISKQLKAADQGGWIEVYNRGDGAGNKSTYVLTHPEKVSHVTTKRLATSLPKGKPRDYRKVSQNSTNPQVDKSRSAQVLEVPEGTESTSTPAARSRVTRAPRASARREKPADDAPKGLAKPRPYAWPDWARLHGVAVGKPAENAGNHIVLPYYHARQAWHEHNRLHELEQGIA